MNKKIVLLLGLCLLPAAVLAAEDMDWSYASGVYARQDYLNRLQDRIADLPPAHQNAIIAAHQTYVQANPCQTAFPAPCAQQLPAPVYYEVQPTYQPAGPMPMTRPCLIPIRQIDAQRPVYQVQTARQIPDYNFDAVSY
ncbi:MAG: hypothetical protein PHX68_03675 [Alphaproteobacteria bacterium]|nr:hypothetical protein [Alphaproteobacteria bacterium]